MTAGCCEKTDFQASRFWSIGSHIFLSLFPPPRSLFLSPIKPPFSSLFCLRVDRWDSRSRRGSFIAFHFRDELTRSIGAWQKCNAREVRGHRLRSHACEGEKQSPCAPGLYPRSALCELSHRAFARPHYETPIIRVKWGIRENRSTKMSRNLRERRNIGNCICVWYWFFFEKNVKILNACKKMYSATLRH